MTPTEKKTTRIIKKAVGKTRQEPLTWADVDAYLRQQGSSLEEFIEDHREEFES